MSRPHFPPNDASDYRDIIRRLEALERSPGGFATLPTYLLTGSFTPGFGAAGAFLNMPGPPSRTITKVQTDTFFVVHGHFSSYKTSTADYIDMAINFNGVDHWMSRFFFNTTGQHQDAGVVGHLATPAPPGDYVVTLRWRAGSGLCNVDGNDFYHLSFKEGFVA